MNKILFVGSHSCSNRGDMAILRGLIEEFKKEFQEHQFTIFSREDESSGVLYTGHELVKDQLYPGVKSLRQKLKGRVDILVVFFASYISYALARLLMSARQKRFCKILDDHDFVIQVGGSFLVDHYGLSQFEYILLSVIKGKRIYLLGHSYGPFRSFMSKLFAKRLIKKVRSNYYREVESRLILDKLEVKNYFQGADSAWLVEGEFSSAKKNIIGLTLRDLYPFDSDLGVSQSEYEEKTATLINNLNKEGYKVIIYSTCTGFGGYWKDDRVIGFKVKKLVKDKSMVEVVIDEIDDVELGKRLGECRLVIGTRLHSAIIAMNFGTPAYTIFYEHKSRGVVSKLLDEKFCLKIQDLDTEETLEKIKDTLTKIDQVQSRMLQNLKGEKQLARDMVYNIRIKENCF